MSVLAANQVHSHGATNLRAAQAGTIANAPAPRAVDVDSAISDDGTPTAIDRAFAQQRTRAVADDEAAATFGYIECVADVRDLVDGNDDELDENNWRQKLRAVRV